MVCSLLSSLSNFRNRANCLALYLLPSTLSNFRNRAMCLAFYSLLFITHYLHSTLSKHAGGTNSSGSFIVIFERVLLLRNVYRARAIIKISDFLMIFVYVDDKLCCKSKTRTHFYLCTCLFMAISNSCNTKKLNKSTLCRVISYDKLNISLYYLRILF